MRLLREPNRHDISPSSCIRGEAILGGGGDRDRGRRHILSLNGRIEIPKTKGATVSGTFRYMSGAPFTIHDTNFDTDQNGELFDPLPAGTYSGIARNALQNIENRGGRNGGSGFPRQAVFGLRFVF